jgi:hypothetical protein
MEIGADSVANLGVFGKVDTRDLTYLQFRAEVERRIEAAWEPPVRGSGDSAGRAAPWKGIPPPIRRSETCGLSRHAGGVRSYDLHLAERSGAFDQDPLLRPGDTVTVTPRGRELRLSGEVRRPGTVGWSTGARSRRWRLTAPLFRLRGRSLVPP